MEPFQQAFKGIIRARLRDEYHAGIGCRALLFLTESEMQEQPPCRHGHANADDGNANHEFSSECDDLAALSRA